MRESVLNKAELGLLESPFSNLRITASSIAMGIALVSAAPAWAQEAPVDPDAQEEEASDAEAEEEAEEDVPIILVTGTSIRGVAPVGSPVVGLNEEALQSRGATTLAEAIRQIPQMVNTGSSDTNFGRGGAAGNRNSGNGLNLRGLGGGATLTVLDSHRLPDGSFDPSVIPSLAIGRVEVMTDGGSAVYGADAVAGVVNLIMRRNFDGAQFRATYGFADGVDQIGLSGIIGTDWGSGSVFVAAEYNRRSRLAAADRDFYTDDFSAWGRGDQRPFYGNPGTIVVGSGANLVYYGIPSGQDGRDLDPPELLVGQPNRQSIYLGADAVPEVERMSIAGRLEQDVTDWLRFSVYGFGAHRESLRYPFLTTGANFGPSLIVPRSNPFFVHPTNPNAASVNVLYNFVPEFGAQEYFGKIDLWYGTAAMEADLGSNWQVEAFFSRGHSFDYNETDAPNSAALLRALADTNPATAFNPFGSGASNNPDTWAQIIAFVGNSSEFDMNNYGIKADGPLFALPGGDLRLAIGGTIENSKNRAKRFDNFRTPTNATVVTFADTTYRRTVKSAFGELYVPVTAPEWGLGELTLSIAGRVDRYDDFQTTAFNPKGGFTWDVGSGLTFRGSYGTSFRAPSAESLDEVSSGRYRVLNYRVSATTQETIPVLILSGGNANLKPETARIFSLGIDYQPEWIDSLRLGATYFNIRWADRLGAPAGGQDTLLRPELAPYVMYNPPLQLVLDYLARPGGSPGTIPPDQVKAIIEGRTINAAITQVSGLDLSVGYEFDLLDGQWDASASFVHFFEYLEQAAPTLAAVSTLDTVGNTISWQGRGQLSYRHDSGLKGTLFGNYTGSYQNQLDPLYPNVTIPPYLTLDLSLSYAFPEESRIFNGLELTLTVRNFTDKAPNFVYNLNPVLPFDPTVGDMFGRFFQFGIEKSF